MAAGTGGEEHTSSKTWPTLCVAGIQRESRQQLALKSHWIQILVCYDLDLEKLTNLEPQFLRLKNGVVMPASQDHLGVEYHLLSKVFSWPAI